VKKQKLLQNNYIIKCSNSVWKDLYSNSSLKLQVKMDKEFKFEPKDRELHVRNTPNLRTILEYFEKNLKKGYKVDALRYVLLNQGYSKIEIAEAIKILEEKTKKEKALAKKEEDERLRMQVQEEIRQATQQQKKGFFQRFFGN